MTARGPRWRAARNAKFSIIVHLAPDRATSCSPTEEITANKKTVTIFGAAGAAGFACVNEFIRLDS